MTDFFKSAFSNIFSPSAQTDSQTNQNFNDFVGSNIQISTYRFRVVRQLAEGGYAIVYLIQDVTNGQEYALKRMFSADKLTTQTILDEISYLKKLTSHPNIVKFVAAACEEKDSIKKEFLIVTELCRGGCLIDYIRQNESLSFEQILKIFYQMCKSIEYLHSQVPPIIHRDIKIENFLISNDLMLKLCDFGSASIQQYFPDHTWSANRRSLVEDELAKHTTPMYRPPEMLDLYSNYPIDKQSDIWALGCILYVLCYGKHPFEDSAKLRIINGNYTIPQNSSHSFSEFNDIIRCMLNLDPRDRPPIEEIVFHLENIASNQSFLLNERLNFLATTLQKSSSPTPHIASGSSVLSSTQNDAQKWIGNATSLFKSGLKTVREASSKVINEVVQQTSSQKVDFDICELTSRLVIVPNASSDGLECDAMLVYLERKPFHCVYNLTSKQYHKETFCKIIDIGGLQSKRAPQLSLLLKLCTNIFKYLSDNSKNIVIIHDYDGKSLSALIACSFFLTCACFNQLDSPLSLFAIKRSGHSLSKSQLRYLDYVLNLSTNSSFLPLKNEFNLNSITITSIPSFNRTKNGCTPYVEVFAKDQKVFTNYQEYDLLRKYSSNEGKINFNVNCRLYGDITIIIYHARSILGTAKATSAKICQVQFHTGFLGDQTRLVFKKSELDDLDTPDKYTDSFSIILELTRFSDSPLANDEAWNVTNLNDFKNSRVLFSSDAEMNELLNVYSSVVSTTGYSDNLTNESIQVGQSTFFTTVSTEEYEACVIDDAREDKQKESKLVDNLLDFDEYSSRTSLEVNQTKDAFDLLNLGDAQSFDEPTKNSKNFFGDFDLFNSQVAHEPTKSSHVTEFDLLGFENPVYSSKLSSVNRPSINPATNKQPQMQKSKDPFEDLANFSVNASKPMTFSNSSHQKSTNPSPKDSPVITHKPNYYFPNANQQKSSQQQSNTTTTTKSKPAFDEFLPSDFGKSTIDAKKSIKEIQKAQNGASTNPDTARVNEWVEGKRKNIRALLCTMDRVLWDGYQSDGTKWKQIGMHEIVTAEQVKKCWKRAVLAVHPDKLTDHPQINLARLIYIELNAAMKQFEAEGQQNLF